MIPRRNHYGEAMRLDKLAFLSSSLLIALSSSIPTVAQAARNTPAPGAAPAPGSIDVPDSPTQTLHVISREVVVDVMVTDKNGQPVYGLQQSDFSIEENGRHQAIRSFREYTSSTPIDEPIPPKLPLGVYTNSQATPASGPVNIILLDALHSGASTMVRALDSVSAYFSTMPQGTRVAIFWLSESGLHMMQGFTSDREALKRALHSTTIEVGSNQERHTTDWYTIDALNQLVAYVAGIKGRKNLLWVVPGMPVDLLRDGGYGWKHGNAPPDMGMVHRLMDVYERCTVEQIAVSPIDPRGVQVPSPSGRPVSLGLAQLKVEAVAQQTGGEAFYNNNDLNTAIAKAIDDQSHFYTLSYIPPNQKDDSHYHRIKIQTNQPNVTLVYREGYNAERVPTADAPAPGPALLKASMEGNTPARTQLLFEVGVWPTPQIPVADPKKVKIKPNAPVSYEVHYGFPASEITFLEEPDGHLHGSLQFDIAAYDINRKLVAHLSEAVDLPLAPEEFDQFEAQPYRLNQHINLPPGPISLHVGILDSVSSKVGTLEVPVSVRHNAR
jgi:VWFA-related protein